jgi:thymidylate synthase (FAD)
MRRDPEVGTVYFAVSEAGDRVKIGFTFGDALARVAALRHDAHYPEPYELKAMVTPVSRAVETALHTLYRDDRCRDAGRAREIFHFSPRLQALVSAIQADPHGAITAVLQPPRPDRFEPPQGISVWEGPSWDASPLAKVGETERLSAFLLQPSVSDTRVTVAVDGPALATLSFSSWPRGPPSRDDPRLGSTSDPAPRPVLVSTQENAVTDALRQRWSEPTKVGPNGFVRLIDVMGSDERLVEVARVSTGKGSSKHDFTDAPLLEKDSHAYRRCRICTERVEHWINGAVKVPDARCVEGDRRLIRYMVRHRHSSVMEFAKIHLHVRLPIFVARQWIRHRTGAFSEMSGRYTEMPTDQFFQVDEWRARGGKNRQGSQGVVTDFPGGWALPPARDMTIEDRARTPHNGWSTPGAYLDARTVDLHDHVREVYTERLVFGVANETARVDLPVSTYTEWHWITDAHNLAHFLSLRLDGHAQKEMRDYAEVIAQILADWLPLYWEAVKDWRIDALTLSGPQVRALKKFLDVYDKELAMSATSPAYEDLEEVFNSEKVPKSEQDEIFTRLGLVHSSLVGK